MHSARQVRDFSWSQLLRRLGRPTKASLAFASATLFCLLCCVRSGLLSSILLGGLPQGFRKGSLIRLSRVCLVEFRNALIAVGWIFVLVVAGISVDHGLPFLTFFDPDAVIRLANIQININFAPNKRSIASLISGNEYRFLFVIWLRPL